MKRTAMTLLAALLALGLTACGSGGGELNVDIQAAADAIAESTCFNGDIFAIDADIVPTMYPDLPEGTEAAVYASSGASADEVAVFAAADETSAKTVLSQAQERVADRQESYADYMPDEAEKLSRAVVQQKGRYVMVVVSGDEKTAAELVKGYLG